MEYRGPIFINYLSKQSREAGTEEVKKPLMCSWGWHLRFWESTCEHNGIAIFQSEGLHTDSHSMAYDTEHFVSLVLTAEEARNLVAE